MDDFHFVTMKKFCLFLLLMCFSSIASAIELESGSLHAFIDQKCMNMVVIFDDCMIDHKPYRSVRLKHDDWDQGVEDIIKRFNSGMLEVIDFEIGDFPEARYTLMYYLTTIDDDEDCFGFYRIYDNEERKTVAIINKANGSAGSFGSFFNLLGDAFEDAGKKLVKFILKHANDKPKNNKKSIFNRK